MQARSTSPPDRDLNVTQAAQFSLNVGAQARDEIEIPKVAHVGSFQEERGDGQSNVSVLSKLEQCRLFDDPQPTRVVGKVQPLFLTNQYRLFLWRKMEFKDRKRLSDALSRPAR